MIRRPPRPPLSPYTTLFGSFSYTPAADYNGADSFTFQASDGSLDSNTATISITVTAVNDAPVAASQDLSTAEDTALTGTETTPLNSSPQITSPAVFRPDQQT